MNMSASQNCILLLQKIHKHNSNVKTAEIILYTRYRNVNCWGWVLLLFLDNKILCNQMMRFFWAFISSRFIAFNFYHPSFYKSQEAFVHKHDFYLVKDWTPSTYSCVHRIIDSYTFDVKRMILKKDE